MGFANLFRTPRRRRELRELALTKPLRITVTDLTGQWHEFRLGPGDAVGYGGIRIDVLSAGVLELARLPE